MKFTEEKLEKAFTELLGQEGFSITPVGLLINFGANSLQFKKILTQNTIL